MSSDQAERIMLFDMLEENGESLIHFSYEQRISKLPRFSDSELCVPIRRNYFQLPG